MKNIYSFEDYGDIVSVLNKDGAFLTVRDLDGNLNTMTIGWALAGIIWRRPVLMVAVRPSRYTFNLMENADDFTVTFPFSDMRKELICCGTKSGKNIDKVKECSLELMDPKKVRSPVVKSGKGRFYECRIVQKTLMDKENLDPKYDQDLYQDKSYHKYYFGEIVACYEDK